jgi:cobalt-zinc-cadmium efflux system outer membrane protein
MTFDEIAVLATQNHPGIKQAKRQAEAFHGAWVQAGLKTNPTIGYSAEEMTDESSGLHGITFSQPITPKYKRNARQAAVSKEYQVAQQAYQIQCRKSINDAMLTAYRLTFAYQKYVILDELTRIAQEAQRTSGELLQANETARSAFLDIKIQADRRQIEQREAEIVYRTACKELVNLLGLPEGELIGIADSVESLPPELDESAMLAEILACSPEVLQAYAEVEAAKARLRQQCAEAGLDYETNAKIAYNSETKLSEFSVGVAIPLRLFDRNQGNIKKAQSELSAAHRNVERVQKLITQQYGRQWGDYQTARSRLAAYKENILPEALELRTLAFEAYRRGEYSSHEMLESQRTYAELQIEHLDNMSALMEAHVLLQGSLLSGGLDKPE